MISEVTALRSKANTSTFPVSPMLRPENWNIDYPILISSVAILQTHLVISSDKPNDDLTRVHICGLSPPDNLSLLRKVSESLPDPCQGLEAHNRFDSCELIRPCPEPRLLRCRGRSKYPGRCGSLLRSTPHEQRQRRPRNQSSLSKATRMEYTNAYLSGVTVGSKPRTI